MAIDKSKSTLSPDAPEFIPQSAIPHTPTSTLYGDGSEFATPSNATSESFSEDSLTAKSVESDNSQSSRQAAWYKPTLKDIEETDPYYDYDAESLHADCTAKTTQTPDLTEDTENEVTLQPIEVLQHPPTENITQPATQLATQPVLSKPTWGGFPLAIPPIVPQPSPHNSQTGVSRFKHLWDDDEGKKPDGKGKTRAGAPVKPVGAQNRDPNEADFSLVEGLWDFDSKYTKKTKTGIPGIDFAVVGGRWTFRSKQDQPADAGELGGSSSGVFNTAESHILTAQNTPVRGIGTTANGNVKGLEFSMDKLEITDEAAASQQAHLAMPEETYVQPTWGRTAGWPRKP